MRHRVKVNRAPVLTLWAAVVAERLGFRRAEALALGRAVAGLNAYSKGKSLGLYSPKPKDVKRRRERMKRGDRVTVDLLGRALPVTHTDEGLRAIAKERPIDPDTARRYLASKLDDALDDTRETMVALAKSRPRSLLAAEAYDSYESFRPDIPRGKKGWGAEGWLRLDTIRKLAGRKRAGRGRPGGGS